MNENELIENLGTIARSGSKAFVKQATEAQTDLSTNSSIIGQFGVGFYSVFMVSDFVEVYSLTGDKTKGEKGFYWSSDGTGNYSIGEANDCSRGTKIIVHLRDDIKNEFSDKYRCEEIIKKYSSYLLFPIKLNGSLITSTGAIWSKQSNEVTELQHKEFYQLIGNRYDDPFYTYHSHIESSKFTASCLIYFPSTHEEKFGSGRLKPGLNLYCKKVLVKKNANEIIPDWLRFVKGAIDSENIPIHISRENMQDSLLIKQLKESIMMKIIDFLKRKDKSDKEKYNKWYNEFGSFIKEGVCQDYHHRSRIAKLLRYETNLTKNGEKISLDEYIENMKENQNEIYYLLAPNRENALESPYIESFMDTNTPVILCYAQIDEFVMRNLGSYKSKDIVGIETSTATPNDINENSENSLSTDDVGRLGKWIKNNFSAHINKVEPTYRLKKHPAVLVDHQSQAIRHYLSALGEDVKTPAQKMQVNPSHPIIKGLYQLISDENESNENKAKIICRQLINNAFIAGGLLDDPREMLKVKCIYFLFIFSPVILSLFIFSLEKQRT